ncbi:MAG: arginine-tRNA-protein transferase [Bacteroidetes bacterium]|nr:arginine-tRNA-protein transferase [Bacteroidota bacterium]
MQSNSLSVFRDISFNPNVIESYVPMQALHPQVFDRFCADGWCYWSDLLFRRNFWEWRGHPCRVVLLRIDLSKFNLSKSQRKCLRRNSDLHMLATSLHITSKHEDLFERHAQRFNHNRPMSIYGFFSPWSHVMPCAGAQIEVYERHRLLSVSYFHAGIESMAGNYCIYDPQDGGRSLGTFTMLLEIQTARQLGKRYYYPGFVYDLPSEFDYKLNFNGLEYFDWWGNWYPLERLPVRDWREAWTINPETII